MQNPFSIDPDTYLKEPPELEVAIRRIAKGASYWPDAAFDREKLRKRRARFDYATPTSLPFGCNLGQRPPHIWFSS